ncbi:hypothetical protein [Streptomyces lunalinharesii]|uniref:Uncharacterized protein n=1 Tax=Streptomyces lunalinharesii TaxID=333384 RepID=A0ABP6ERT4_9ACTN
MALAFREIEVPIGPRDCSAAWEHDEKFDFPRKIKVDDNDNLVVDVAIKAYDLEALANGNPTEFMVWHDKVSVELTTSGHRSGSVRLSAWLRPHPNYAASSGYGFRGTVKALVIADLEDGHT